MTWRFFIASVAISYIVGIPMFLLLSELQRQLGLSVPFLNDRVLAFGPTLAAIGVAGWQFGPRAATGLLQALLRWRASASIYFGIVLLPPLVQLSALWALGYADDLDEGFGRAYAVQFALQLLIAALFGGGLGEEIGWRGFMLPSLRKSMSETKAAVIVGAAWFAWHLPAYLLTDKSSSDPLIPFVLVCVAASVVMARLYFYTGQVLWVAILVHGSLNASWYALEAASPRVVQSAGFQPLNDYLIALAWSAAAVIVPMICPQERDAPTA